MHDDYDAVELREILQILVETFLCYDFYSN